MCRSNHRNLQSQANAEIWHIVFERIVSSRNLASYSTQTKPTRYQQAIYGGKFFVVCGFGINPLTFSSPTPSLQAAAFSASSTDM